MNPTGEYEGKQYVYGYNVGGWENIGLYDSVNIDVYNALPEALIKGIIDTYVVSSHGITDSGDLTNGNFYSVDKLYLLSPREVYGASFTSEYDTSNGTSRQLEYYLNNNVTISSYEGAIKKNSSGNDSWWWIRSAHSYYGSTFYYVKDNGDWSHVSASRSVGVSPAFRLAD